MTSPNLFALAEAVVNEVDVDWGSVESSAVDAADRERIRQLRLVAAVGRASRRLLKRWGPFEIRGELGRGSFGTVYRAWDPRVHREVALKLLNGTVMNPDGLITEARILAGVEHPNIVPIYGADVHDGRAGIWMKLVNGKTLKDILIEQGPFGAEEAAGIGRTLCRALATVHGRGFVHRDIKAQNVMREVGGAIVLMDFGAGHALGNGVPASTLGSPAYLAPEVLRGERPSSQSDIYSLGVLLYHLVSGSFPYTASSLEELRVAHDAMSRRHLRDVCPGVPASFLTAVERASAPNRERRPLTVGALDALLTDAEPTYEVVPSDRRRRFLTGAVALGCLAGALAFAWVGSDRVRDNSTAELPNAVAVMDFTAAEGTSDATTFAAGVSSGILANLGRLVDIRVVSFGNVILSRQAIAGHGVGAVLEGQVRRNASRVTITASLIKTASGERLWSDTYERDVADLFAIQSEVCRKIALALKGRVAPDEARLLEFRPYRDTEAFESYLKGRHSLGLRTQDGFRDAIRWFQDALSRDAAFAPAHAGLADTFMLMGVRGYLPFAEALSRAYSSAAQSVSLDPGLAEAHAALGYAQKHRFEWREAEASFMRAIRLRPNYALARQYLGVLLTQFGRFPEALTELTLALSLEPLSVSANSQLAATLLLSRQYDEAIEQASRVLALEPLSSGSHQVIGEALAYKGDYAAALPHLEGMLKQGFRNSQSATLLADIAYAHARNGSRQEAHQIAALLVERYRSTGFPSAAAVAVVYAALGDRDKAFDWLQAALDDGEPEIGYLAVDPKWDTLRADPRFADALRVSRLPPTR